MRITLVLANPDTGERYDAILDGTTPAHLFQLYVPRMSAVFPKQWPIQKGWIRATLRAWPLLVSDQLVSEGCITGHRAPKMPTPTRRPYRVKPLSARDFRARAVRRRAMIFRACRRSARWQVELPPPAIDDPAISAIIPDAIIVRPI